MVKDRILRARGLGSALTRSLIDTVYPGTCVCCSNPADAGEEGVLCWDCQFEVQFHGEPRCETCGIPIAGRVDHAFVCVHCREHPPAYDRAVSVCRYEGISRELIHTLKYQHDLSVVPQLASWMLAAFEKEFGGEEDVKLVPIPLHRRRQRERGFNQSTEICRAMAKQRSRLTVQPVLRRIRHTETQTHLTAAQRRHNVRSAFDGHWFRRGRPPAPTVCLVDDVMTTGATLSAAARCLKKLGAKKVLALTVARG